MSTMETTPGVEEETLLAAAAAPNAAAMLRPISGIYQRNSPGVLPTPEADGHDLMPMVPGGLADSGMREELRLDVDGSLSLNVVSGTIYRALNSRVHWVAKLVTSGPNTWTGTVWFKNGDLGAFPYTNVKIQVLRSGSMDPQGAKVVYSGGGIPNAERSFFYKSPYFRAVEFEFDHVAGVSAVSRINTHDHPNRPASLPAETLTIPRIFQRAGFDAKQSSGGNEISITGAGPNAEWSDMEMHDAMQQYWSRFADEPQWALWVFYAALHEEGARLGGIMFDDIGGNHRQGTAIFTESFIAEGPPNDPAKEAWVRRMQFWCACHEMGHAFNLAHSWQKAVGTPWVPLANEPEARSFMNYPYNVAGGPTAFFQDFEYRFSSDELLFMRHAPEKFVQMGNADWFDHHAFEQANILAEPTYRLDLRVQRPQGAGSGRRAPEFEFLEPVVLELKLTNVSRRPQVVPAKLLSQTEHLTVVVKRKGRPARELIPFATYCWQPEFRALAPMESVYESLFASVGQGGWDIAEPGYYTVQVVLHREIEDVVSNPLAIRVAPPRGYTEEYLAQDFFSDAVGRILTFDGSRVLEAGNEAMQEVASQLPERKVALHIQIAQASAVMREYKELAMSGGGGGPMAPQTDARGAITTRRPDLDAAQVLLTQVLEKPAEAAESLGNIDLNYYLTRFSNCLQDVGEKKQAAGVLDSLASGLTDRKASASVVDQVKGMRAALGAPADGAALPKGRKKKTGK